MSTFLRKLKQINIDRYSSKERRFYVMSLMALQMVDEVIKEAENSELTNSQTFIDWLDNLNERSVKY